MSSCKPCDRVENALYLAYELLGSEGVPAHTDLISPVLGLSVTNPGDKTVPFPTIKVRPQMHRSSLSSPSFILNFCCRCLFSQWRLSALVLISRAYLNHICAMRFRGNSHDINGGHPEYKSKCLTIIALICNRLQEAPASV